MVERKQSEIAPVPPRPKGKEGALLYWQEHKDEILADLARIGYSATRERWNISPGVLTRLRGRRGAKSKPPQDKVSPLYGLPAFPLFDPTWPEVVQLHWFDTYLGLVKVEELSTGNSNK